MISSFFKPYLEQDILIKTVDGSMVYGKLEWMDNDTLKIKNVGSKTLYIDISLIIWMEIEE